MRILFTCWSPRTARDLADEFVQLCVGGMKVMKWLGFGAVVLVLLWVCVFIVERQSRWDSLRTFNDIEQSTAQPASSDWGERASVHVYWDDVETCPTMVDMKVKGQPIWTSMTCSEESGAVVVKLPPDEHWKQIRIQPFRFIEKQIEATDAKIEPDIILHRQWADQYGSKSMARSERYR